MKNIDINEGLDRDLDYYKVKSNEFNTLYNLKEAFPH